MTSVGVAWHQWVWHVHSWPKLVWHVINGCGMALMSVSSVLHGLSECGMALVSVVASLGVAWCCMALVGYELSVCVWNCFIRCLFDS